MELAAHAMGVLREVYKPEASIGRNIGAWPERAWLNMSIAYSAALGL
jgi:hypothetical protein